MKKIQLLFLFIFLTYACDQKNENVYNTHTIKVVEAKGYVVPKDSMCTPKVAMVDEKELERVLAGKPKIVSANLNIHPAGIPKKVLAGEPRVCTPGQDNFLLPKIVPAIDSSFVAGIPECVIVKDARIKDHNPQNFSSYSKLQGLKHQRIHSIAQDRSGNLWFGNGGGATKYDGKNFTLFTEKEGLGNNMIRSIFEDRNGNLWFGTNGRGATKYDGKNFTNFSAKEGLSNSEVTSILEDRSGNLWFSTFDEGVMKYDGKNFTHFTIKEGLSSNRINSITEDRSGNLWFGTNGNGVIRYDGISFRNYSTAQGLANNFVFSILEDKTGNLWFGTDVGISMHDGKFFTTFSDNEGLPNNRVTSIVEDKSGNFWFGTQGGGVTKYDGKNFTHFSENEGLNSNNVLSILEDKSGNLWFGTQYAGVTKYNGKNFTHITEQDGLSNKVILSIMEDRLGNLWVGTRSGATKYDGKNFTHFTEKEGLMADNISSILEDRFGNLWFASYGSGVTKYDGKYYTYFTDYNFSGLNSTGSILEDRFGNLWFGTVTGATKYDGKNFTKFSAKEGLSNATVMCILEDRLGNLWFSTFGEGVVKYDGKIFTHFTIKEGLSSNWNTMITEDRSGNLWFATLGGVTKYDGKNFTHFTEKEGLSSNGVSSILEDRTGNIWFGTRVGLSKLSQKKLVKLLSMSKVEGNDKVKNKNINEEDVFFTNYNYEDGFLAIGCSPDAICEDKNGIIWVGTSEMLTAYHPPLVDVADTVPPNIQLNGLQLFNENIAWVNLLKKQDSSLTLGNGVTVSDYSFNEVSKWYGVPEHLSLAYNNNYFTFSFIGITMNQPKNMKYRYKLEGLDKDWSALTSSNDAPYGNLPHGTFTFKVKAMNSEGVWSQPLEYTFTIRPPWWLTWWFKTLVVLLVVGSVWYYIKWRERTLKAEKEILEKTVVERTAEVVEQKNLIQEKHREITDSINYAERIQRSFLATKELLDKNLKEYFALFQPKEAVSGDFYWAGHLSNGHFALITADSTGHGVPGAIMSILNISCLENAIKDKLIEPKDILNHTRTNIIERLKNDGSKEGGKDGMDCSILCFDKQKTKITFSGANNPVWIVRRVTSSADEGGVSRSDTNSSRYKQSSTRTDIELIELEPDKMPVGKHDKDSISFTQYELGLEAGDVIYSLTDGYPDQFGGPKGKKFMYKKLKELLISISTEPMNIQKEILAKTLSDWKGNSEQVDDICVIGVRV